MDNFHKIKQYFTIGLSHQVTYIRLITERGYDVSHENCNTFIERVGILFVNLMSCHVTLFDCKCFLKQARERNY